MSESDLGGIKEVVAEITGQGVFARLKYEAGVHRVQRVPVTEGSGRIHTSAATVAVLPEAEDVDIAIDDKDLRIDVYRASGAGGQHVNRTESAVRITHLPTGLVVAIQDEKSQHKNKAKALKILKARLYEQERAAKDSERAADRKGQVGSGDRSERIRTYNFPQNRLTDHRINLTLYKLEQVVAGEALDEVIEPLINEDAGGPAGRGRLSTVAALLREGGDILAAAGIPRPRSEARLLLAARDRRIDASRLLGHPEAEVPDDGAGRYLGWVARRAAREPFAYIVGHAEFWSLDFVVGPAVLVPRADSETLIEAAIHRFADPARPLRILDIGVGSGCLLLALLQHFPHARGVGTDTQRRSAGRGAPERRAARAGARARGWNSHPGPTVSTGRSTSCSATRPISASADIAGLEPEVARFEPQAALDGGPDGLDAYRAILPALPQLLATDAAVFLEIGTGQESQVVPMASPWFAGCAHPPRSGRNRTLPRARSPRVLIAAQAASAAVWRRTAVAAAAAGSPSETCTVGVAIRMPFSFRRCLSMA